MIKILLKIGNFFYGLMVLGVVAFALLFIGTKIDLLGYEIKVVQSGSMEPAIPVGAIVVVKGVSDYKVGDIITFGRDTKKSIPVTHRIVEKTVSEKEGTSYITKGDANEDADGINVRERDIIGKVVLTVPYAGYIIDFARTPLGYGLLVGLPALLIILDEFADIIFEIHKYRFKRRRQGQVGYRTPSRERNPRDFARATPDMVFKPKTPRQNPPRPKMLDIRPYVYERSQFSS